MARASNFTDAQKAELFVMHRATCVYTGEKLWILDGGADLNFPVDWADHLTPVAKGGLSTLENGVCASWSSNRDKRDRDEAPDFLFFKGKPTAHFRKLGKRVSRQQAQDLERFANLQHSDWYFNRSLNRLLLGVDDLYNPHRGYTRGEEYYAAAALKTISKWRKIVAREAVATLEERDLAPAKPSRDQKLMLSVRGVDDVEAIRGIMKKLLPFYGPR